MVTILLLEPDRILQNIYTRALKRAGYAVRAANSAQDAIRIADGHLIDIVVMEMQLGFHNGIEFLYEFRSYAEWQSIPVIVHSVIPPEEFQVSEGMWHLLGITTYHYKPRTSLQTLLNAITEQLHPVR